jgi:hypothetical protein
MFIFKFARQTLNKRHFWSKIGDTAPSTISLLYTCFIYYYLTNVFGEWKQQTIQLFRFVQRKKYLASDPKWQGTNGIHAPEALFTGVKC